jgi:hypothetical protein
MKYVVLSAKHKTLTQEFPFVFHNNLVHSYAVAAFKSLLEGHNTWRDVAVISAGYYSPIDGTCDGKSETLKLASRGIIDERLILGSDYGAGYS